MNVPNDNDKLPSNGDPARWQKVKEIFNSILELEEGQGAAYLAAACNGDEDIRQQVEELLASYKTSFLEEKSSELADGEHFLAPGERLGHFEIAHLLGSGRMGQVYLAQDRRLDRRVAIKVYSPKFSGNSAYLARFVRELFGGRRLRDARRNG